MAITEEHLNRVNVEALFNVTNRNNITNIGENLISTNVDEDLVDSTETANNNLRRNVVKTLPMTKCTLSNCLFRNSDTKQFTKQLYETECQSTSGNTSSSDRNQYNNATMAQSIGCTNVKQMLLKDLQQVVQKICEFSHFKRTKIEDYPSDLPTESIELSEVDDVNIVIESVSISEESSDNLTEENNPKETEKVAPACFDLTECTMQITDDKSRIEHVSSIKCIETCSDTRNSANQSSKITTKNKIKKTSLKKYSTSKISTSKKAKQNYLDVYRHHNIDKKKIRASHAKRKPTGARLFKNYRPSKPRFEKNYIQNAVIQPISTEENDKNISKCDENTNIESDFSEPLTDIVKLEDIIKNSSDKRQLKEIKPATKHHREDEKNDNKTSEVTTSTILGPKKRPTSMHQEVKQILVCANKTIIVVDPVERASINPNTSETSHDSSNLNTSENNLANSEKQIYAMIQLENDKVINDIPDHLTIIDPDNTLPDEVKKATKPCNPKRHTSQNKDKKVDNIQKSSIVTTVKECNFPNEENLRKKKQLKVVLERFVLKIDNENTHQNNTTVQEEDCDSTTTVIENRPEISSPVETLTSISQATLACNTNAENFKLFPVIYSESTENERQMTDDWQSTPLDSNVDVEMNINNTEICMIDSEIHIVNNDIIICEEEDSTTMDAEMENLNSNYRYDKFIMQ